MVRWLAIILCPLLALQPAFGQQAAAQSRVRIVVVQGEGNRNVTQQITAKPLVVRVEDANNRPVGGATVTFTAPARGPSGEFANDSPVIRVITGTDGLANAGPYHPNANEGPYQIQVRAEFHGEMATVVISQTNIARGRGHKKLIAIVAIVGGAVAAAGIAARSKRSTSSSSSPASTSGEAAVGAPR